MTTDDPAQRERELVERMKRSLWPGRVQRHPDGREDIWLVGESVELEGSCPSTELVVRFRLVEKPGVLYGWRHPVWHPEDPDWTILFAHFDEAAITRTSRGYQPGADGVIWLPNFSDSF